MDNEIDSQMVTLDELDSVPDINFDAAMARMGNNVNIFKKMAEMYMADTPAKLRNLAKVLDKEQLDVARHLGHALKGTSATIGAEKMQSLCRTIEVAAAQENIELVRQTVGRLNSAYPDVLRSLAEQDLG